MLLQENERGSESTHVNRDGFMLNSFSNCPDSIVAILCKINNKLHSIREFAAGVLHLKARERGEKKKQERKTINVLYNTIWELRELKILILGKGELSTSI